MANLRGIPGWRIRYRANVVASLQEATASLVGEQPHQGTVAAVLSEAMFSGSAAQTFEGGVVAALQKATASLTGVQQPEGQIVAALQAAGFSGTDARFGPLTAELQPAIAALAGEQIQSGAMAAELQNATAAFAGGALSGTLAAELQNATAALTGSHQTILSDLFNRADSANMGASWVDRNADLGIFGNEASPYTANAHNVSSHVTSLGGGDMEVSFTIGTGGAGTGSVIVVALGFNTAGEGVFGYWTTGGTADILSMANSWNPVSGATVRDTATASFTVGDTMTLRRVGNVYTMRKNGAAISGSSWTDSGDIVPRDANHGLVGLGIHATTGFTSYWQANSWEAKTL